MLVKYYYYQNAKEGNFMSNFQKNLKTLSQVYTQKCIAEKTGFSQSSINNYLTKQSEPSIQFLIALKNAFGICTDDFLFSDISMASAFSYERFVGNYIVCYFNNSAYKGEVHNVLNSTLNYGVISVTKTQDLGGKVIACATFFKEKKEAVKLLKETNALKDENAILDAHKKYNNFYKGTFSANTQSIFVHLSNSANGDQCFIILNNPHSTTEYIGGVGTVNSVARGREHNPCVEFIILSKKLINKTDAEVYDCLNFDDYKVNLDFAMKDILNLFKRLYVEQNDLSLGITETQKLAIVQNKLEYHFNSMLSANLFRFAKISNKEDDAVFKLLREGIDV